MVMTAEGRPSQQAGKVESQAGEYMVRAVNEKRKSCSAA
jgi:hypothetical protein